ncbi:MAG: ribulokinase [Clostridiales bacterium]|mgnify:CR=1 FL=1|nr:ribulokinase [Clostridiales bacterium]
MSKYTIGIDYGTLSGRAVLVDVATGGQIASATFDYPHGVMDEALPSGKKLGHDWALQHPQDYVDVLTHTIPKILKDSGISPEDVIGLGTDFTACTVLPVKADGTPLCMLPEFSDNPNAYVKLWKHHAAQDKANRLNEIAANRGEKWLKNYGGKISSEWLFPKLWQILDEAPEVYTAMDHFVEAADWIVWQMTGVQTRNSCCAGYKAIYNKATGYPDPDFFKALDPRLENVIAEKLSCPVTSLGEKAGGLTSQMAARLGLKTGTAVCIGNVDAHVCVPAVGIDGPGKMLAIIGTSTCHMMMGTQERQVPGMCGVVQDGIMPGFPGYEAGQSCVGDHFAWFVDNCCPSEYREAAKAVNMGIHEYLTGLAARQKPGEHGLLALDWWNGNRSVLVDVDLTGMMLGMTLQTKPEDMYRALLEATAYGTRMIVENYREHEVAVDAFYASGGISQKNPLMMQIYADVLNMDIKIAGAAQGPALGSAIFAAVAAGKDAGGYDDVFTAARAMGQVKDLVYKPIAANVAVYNKLFAEYRTLHDHFGRGANDVMKRLKELKKHVTQ